MRMPHMMRWHSAGMLLLSSAAAAAGPRVHTVFCAECTNNFDYKSIGAFWSHNISGMPGGITRLLACDENQMKTYRGMSIGPTFVHINHGHMRQQRARCAVSFVSHAFCRACSCACARGGSRRFAMCLCV